MGSGQWTVDSGQWTVDSGQWTVGSGQWQWALSKCGVVQKAVYAGASCFALLCFAFHLLLNLLESRNTH